MVRRVAETAIARLRRGSARPLEFAGGAAIKVSKRLAADEASLEGDRVVEWPFCVGRLNAGPARILDFRADTGFLALAVAERPWRRVDRDSELATENSEPFYTLGLFILIPR
jgi:hypothetical protein